MNENVNKPENDVKHFDLIAKDYDNENRVKRAAFFANEIRAHIKNGQQKTAVEYGCGTGLVGLNLAHEFRSLLLADVSQGMIAQVEEKLRALPCPSVSALCCDFLEEVPEGLSADYIFMSLALHHVPDTAGILKRFYDILNPGGHLLVADINRDENSSFFHAYDHGFNGHHGFTEEELGNLAKEAGFKSSTFKLFFSGSKITDGKEMKYSFFIFDAEK